MKTIPTILAGIILSTFSFSASAQEIEGVWVIYYIKDDTSVVTGLMQVAIKENKKAIPASYSLKRISKFIAQDCAGGKVGKITLGKQKTKRRWNLSVRGLKQHARAVHTPVLAPPVVRFRCK
ncbi:hypothetical protein PEL8287_02821 [Roseovarius litorisediminis]|uniref:DUF2147 domain-containing protein n=1 Tax=Roseovarius litorisediminis TaxID=1312363 RepID=A0A1Y5T368_9RHOB|nr:hypothetical protein [Roseovarius litorisediminis]SLN52943.1 hypothetical protein PEL8287_02821 [Roseovarius litorisediminis]